MIIITEHGRRRLVAHYRRLLWGHVLAAHAADDRAGALLAAIETATTIAPWEDPPTWREIVRLTERHICNGDTDQ